VGQFLQCPNNNNRKGKNNYFNLNYKKRKNNSKIFNYLNNRLKKIKRNHINSPFLNKNKIVSENKKNKNPPPMPDFRQPRKIKPTLLLV